MRHSVAYRALRSKWVSRRCRIRRCCELSRSWELASRPSCVENWRQDPRAPDGRNVHEQMVFHAKRKGRAPGPGLQKPRAERFGQVWITNQFVPIGVVAVRIDVYAIQQGLGSPLRSVTIGEICQPVSACSVRRFCCFLGCARSCSAEHATTNSSAMLNQAQLLRCVVFHSPRNLCFFRCHFFLARAAIFSLSLTLASVQTVAIGSEAVREWRSSEGSERRAEVHPNDSTATSAPLRSPMPLRSLRFGQFLGPFDIFPNSFLPVRGKVRRENGGRPDFDDWNPGRKSFAVPIAVLLRLRIGSGRRT